VANQYAYDRVWEIYKKLKPKPEDLLSDSRFFVRKGKFWFRYERKKKKKKRHFFLFNDILLLCRKEGPSRYHLRVYITLRALGVSIKPLQTVNYPARLETRLQTFIFYFETLENRNIWIKEIEASTIEREPQIKLLSDSQLIKQHKEFTEEINTLNLQVAELLRDNQTNDPDYKSSSIVPVSKSTPDPVHSHILPDPGESSDGASSESPVIKKKKKKVAKKRRDRKNRNTIGPKTGNLLGSDFLHFDIPAKNTQSLAINPFLSPENTQMISGNPQMISGISGNPQGIGANPRLTLNLLQNPFMVPPQGNALEINDFKNPFLN